jgi:multidrug resistance efflux pump
MPRTEEVDPLSARYSETKVRVAEQEDLLGRAQRLYRAKAMSLDEYHQNVFAYEAAREQDKKAAADLRLLKAGAWSADLAVSEAAIKQAEAAVKQVETELEKLEIKAPVAGQLLQINIRKGEFVGAQPGQNLIVIGDVEDLHVRVDIDEDDVPRFRPNTPATAYVRGQEDHAYRLEFVRVEPYLIPKKSLTRDNTERNDTRVLQVVYRLSKRPDPDHRLYVGQQMDVYIDRGPDAAPESSPTDSNATAVRGKPGTPTESTAK